MERRDGETTDRIATLIADVGRAPTVERAKETSDELVRALVAFYGDGLERILEIVHANAGERSEAIFAALCEDSGVENLLALHDLHPLGLEDRVRAALASIRPYLESHDGDVELVRIEAGIAYVRLSGSCDGCRSSAATLAGAVEAAIFERVSEIVEVRADSADATPRATIANAHALRLQSDWVELAAIPELGRDGIAHVACSGTAVLFARHEQTLYAYRDRCPSCTRALDGATIAWPFVRCSACGERFDLVHAGRAEDDATLFAEPFPLVRDGDRVRVAIPVGA